MLLFYYLNVQNLIKFVISKYVLNFMQYSKIRKHKNCVRDSVDGDGISLLIFNFFKINNTINYWNLSNLFIKCY